MKEREGEKACARESESERKRANETDLVSVLSSAALYFVCRSANYLSVPRKANKQNTGGYSTTCSKIRYISVVVDKTRNERNEPLGNNVSVNVR